jgi:hypothetical protein
MFGLEFDGALLFRAKRIDSKTYSVFFYVLPFLKSQLCGSASNVRSMHDFSSEFALKVVQAKDLP